jgi:TetR/AcrR family transcriptional regulator
MDNTRPETADTAEQRIYEAAHDVFLHKGYDGAKMQEIADRAGINKALLHYYYRSKDKLYEMVAKAVIQRAIAGVHQTINADESLELKIGRLIDFYVDTLGRNIFVVAFLVSEMNKHPEQFRDRILPSDLPKPERFFQQVRDAVEAGRIRPIQPEHLLVNIISMSVFPFLAQPMMRIVLGKNQPDMQQFLQERKAVVRDYIFHAIKPLSP